jgi:hypothetical protein
MWHACGGVLLSTGMDLKGSLLAYQNNFESLFILLPAATESTVLEVM